MLDIFSKYPPSKLRKPPSVFIWLRALSFSPFNPKGMLNFIKWLSASTSCIFFLISLWTWLVTFHRFFKCKTILRLPGKNLYVYTVFPFYISLNPVCHLYSYMRLICNFLLMYCPGLVSVWSYTDLTEWVGKYPLHFRNL